MICWANGVLPDYFVFKFFFRFRATSDKYIFSACCGGNVLVPNGKAQKNMQDK